jgi:hypothetical protein
MADPNPSLLAYPEFPAPLTGAVLNQFFTPRPEELRWVWQMSFGTVSFGGVTRLLSDESTTKTRLSYRDTPLLLTVPNDKAVRWDSADALVNVTSSGLSRVKRLANKLRCPVQEALRTSSA